MLFFARGAELGEESFVDPIGPMVAPVEEPGGWRGEVLRVPAEGGDSGGAPRVGAGYLPEHSGGRNEPVLGEREA